jgi:RNA polymerase sigma-54 factor
MVHKDGELVSVELVRGLLPSVTIDPMAEELLGGGSLDGETRGYLRGKVDRARSVAEAVEMRGVTLLRVAEGVIRRQPLFMTDGLSGLRPLSMTELAAELELAPSTISRAVAGKSMQTPFGILPLRQFFQTSTSTAGEGGAAATEAVRIRVKHLIDDEDPSAPLSDEALVEALGDSGLAVARRTVAKYRKELGIPSSYQRKRHV